MRLDCVKLRSVLWFGASGRTSDLQERDVADLTDREIANLNYTIAVPIQDGNVECSYRVVDRCTRLAAYICVATSWEQTLGSPGTELEFAL